MINMCKIPQVENTNLGASNKHEKHPLAYVYMNSESHLSLHLGATKI